MSLHRGHAYNIFIFIFPAIHLLVIEKRGASPVKALLCTIKTNYRIIKENKNEVSINPLSCILGFLNKYVFCAITNTCSLNASYSLFAEKRKSWNEAKVPLLWHFTILVCSCLFVIFLFKLSVQWCSNLTYCVQHKHTSEI